jgi:hypothetical protein
MLPKLYNKDNL